MQMAVACTIFWSVDIPFPCHATHASFSGLSVTVRSAAEDGGGMPHFLVFLSP